MDELPDDVRYLEVGGTTFCVIWEELGVGSSFFLPTTATVAQVKSALRPGAKYFNVELDASPRVERGLYGIRVWRLA